MIIIDLEATCGDESYYRDEQETIEIGAVDITGTPREFARFIKPVRHPVITQICTALTGIAQRDVDEGDAFSEVLPQLEAWMGGICTFFSWGTFDRDQLHRDCRWHGIDYPFPSHVNLADVYKKNSGSKHGHRQAMRRLGLTPLGRHHRGIDDAHNIARLALEMRKRGWLP